MANARQWHGDDVIHVLPFASPEMGMMQRKRGEHAARRDG